MLYTHVLFGPGVFLIFVSLVDGALRLKSVFSHVMGLS